MKPRCAHKPLFLLLFSWMLCVAAVNTLWADSSPRLNNGKKWRIGYYDGGPFSDYTDTMRTLVMALIDMGWIQEPHPPQIHEEVPRPYWPWLSECESPYLSFNIEDGYSANWDEQNRSRIRSALLEKLKNRQIDLVIAMGTWAGQDLATDEHAVPTLVLSTSDPIKAGIIKSAKNSGLNHVTARVDPHRYIRQLRMFHRIAGFQDLGIAFEDSADGRIYSAINEAAQVGKERGFKITTCKVIDATTDIEASDDSCYACYRQLAKQVDAIYVTALTCVDRRTAGIADIFKDAGVPSFAMIGSKQVRKGILFSISSDSGYAGLGKYNATKFGEILNGTQPGKLNQLFEDPLDIAVNMQTARAIGFEMPNSILRIATEIYGR